MSPGQQPVQVVRADRVLTPDRELTDGWVAVRGAEIVEVGQGTPPHGTEYAGPTHPLLVPGFVDLHNHGGGGASYAEGARAARRARSAHLRQGTTSVVASLVTDTVDALRAQVSALAPLVAAGELAGIHLEGPWLAPQWCGAHQPDLLTDPVAADVTALAEAGRIDRASADVGGRDAGGRDAGGRDGRRIDTSGQALVLVTLAPERPGALAAIEALTARGVAVAIGHTDASYEQTRAAIEAGARVATHLYNAARPPHHREPGPSVALLEDPRVHIESIVDGVHLHPAVVRATARAAGQRWVLVTDAMPAALCGDGSYRLGALRVDVVDEVARLPGGQGLAGSTLSLDRAVRTAVACGVPLQAAVTAATAAPAEALGRPDLGRLEPGRRADLVALDDQLEVRAVCHGGHWLDRDCVDSGR